MTPNLKHTHQNQYTTTWKYTYPPLVVSNETIATTTTTTASKTALPPPIKPTTHSIEDASSLISNWLLTYLDPLFKTGASRPIQSSDIGPPSKQDLSSEIYGKLLIEYEKQPIKDKSAGRALWVANGPGKIYYAIFLYLLSNLMIFIPVLMLNDLVKHFQSLETSEIHETLIDPWYEVALLGTSPFFVSILQSRSSVIMQHFSIFVGQV